MYRLRIFNTIQMPLRQGLQTCEVVSSLDTVTTTVYSEDFSGFSTGSFTAGTGAITVSNVYPGQLKIESVWTYRPKATSPTFSVVAGKTYKINIDLVTISAGTGKTHTVRVRVYYPGGNTFTDYTTTGTKTFTFTPGSSGSAYIDISSTITPGSGGYSPGNPNVIIDNVSISYDSSFTVYDTVCNYSKNGYRYGFNGMEKVNEIAGDGNDYDFGARIYDGRLGRWFSVDPLFEQFEQISPFCFGLDNPILYVDIDGEKPKVTVIPNEDGSVTILIVNTIYVYSRKNRLDEDELNSYLIGGLVDLGNKKVNIVFKNEIVYVKNKRQARKKIEENGGYGVILNFMKGKGRSNYQNHKRTNRKNDEIFLYKENGKYQTQTIAHEVGHDLGFADKYVDVKGWGSLSTIAFINGLMGIGNGGFNEFELSILAYDVLYNNSLETTGGYPVDFAKDELKPGMVLEVTYQPAGSKPSKNSVTVKINKFGKAKEVKKGSWWSRLWNKKS